MKDWVYYGLIVIIIYATWELLWERVMHKHDACWCISLFTILSAALLSCIVLWFHVSEKNHKFGVNMTNMVWFWIFFMGVFMVLTNSFYGLSVKASENVGLVAGFTSVYVVLVFLASSYLSRSVINWEHLLGLVMLIVGLYLVQK